MSRVTEPKQKQIIQEAFMFARITRDVNEIGKAGQSPVSYPPRVDP